MSRIFVSAIIFLLAFNIYLLSSPGNTSYDYYLRLSNSFINGKLTLSENPAWLNELVPVGDKYYVVYPPMPAILMVPAVLLFGNATSQTFFSIFLGAINVLLVYFVLKKLRFGEHTSILVTFLFAFGTNHWFLSSVGSSWYLAHIVALFFMLLALYESFSKGRLFLIGFLIGASFWARTPVIFCLGFFYIYFHKRFYPLTKKNLLNFFLLNFGVGIFILFDAYYNFLRFGDFSPFSPYSLIPNLDKDPVFSSGFMSLAFIPRHIDAAFLRLPKYQDSFPYLVPSLYSLAVWFTTPAIIYIFRFKKFLLEYASLSAIIPTLLILFMWAGVGYSQFGYRFLQDVMPFILILIASGIGHKPSKVSYFLVILSILVNTWGVILINKFNIFTL